MYSLLVIKINLCALSLFVIYEKNPRPIMISITTKKLYDLRAGMSSGYYDAGAVVNLDSWRVKLCNSRTIKQSTAIMAMRLSIFPAQSMSNFH